MSGLAKQIETYSTDYIDALPEEERVELIDGVIYNMASPSIQHQRAVGQLFNLISNHIRANNGSCEPFIAPFAVRLNKDSHTHVEPDISVICDPSKLSDRGCEGAPDWVIEVVSPSSSRMDYLVKLFKYRTAGVREYWIVDTDENRIFVYNFEGDEDFQAYAFEDTIKAGIFEDLQIDFSQINI